MNQQELMEYKDLKHKAHKLQTQIEDMNRHRKTLTTQLVKIHARLSFFKVKCRK